MAAASVPVSAASTHAAIATKKNRDFEAMSRTPGMKGWRLSQVAPRCEQGSRKKISPGVLGRRRAQVGAREDAGLELTTAAARTPAARAEERADADEHAADAEKRAQA